jgi:hypothetical protein
VWFVFLENSCEFKEILTIKIAAQAMETGPQLVTFDTCFPEIPGLRMWNCTRN